MKIILLLMAVVPFLVRADETNKFGVLACKNASYTNATIIRFSPIEVVIDFDGGIVRVALTNLPEALHDQYPYNPQKAEEYIASEKQKAFEKQQALQAKQMADMQAMEERAKTARIIRVAEYDGTEKCVAIIDHARVVVLVKNMPRSIATEMKYFEN